MFFFLSSLSLSLALSLRTADNSIRVLHSNYSRSDETNYALFPRSKTGSGSFALPPKTLSLCQGNAPLRCSGRLTCQGKSLLCIWKQPKELERGKIPAKPFFFVFFFFKPSHLLLNGWRRKGKKKSIHFTHTQTHTHYVGFSALFFGSGTNEFLKGNLFSSLPPTTKTHK